MAQKLALLDVLKTPLPGYTQMSPLRPKITFATVQIICDVKFCDGPGILYAKFQNHALTACELPCYYMGSGLLIHCC